MKRRSLLKLISAPFVAPFVPTNETQFDDLRGIPWINWDVVSSSDPVYFGCEKKTLTAYGSRSLDEAIKEFKDGKTAEFV